MTRKSHSSSAGKWFSPWAVFASLVVGTGCGTLAGNPEDDDDKNDGDNPPKSVIVAPVTFHITDAPVDDAKHVYITVASLDVSIDGEGWTKIDLKTATEFDLLALQDGLSTPLAGVDELPTGLYKETRLILAESPPPRIVLANDEEHELFIPSGEKSGIKIKTPFELVTGEPKELTIDFDLRKSVKKQGNGKYMMKPVLRLVENSDAGAIAGIAEDAKHVCAFRSDQNRDDDDEDCDDSVNSTKVKKDGRFTLANLPIGTYHVVFKGKKGKLQIVENVEVKAGVTAEANEPD